MAHKRMFSKDITESDAFADMPLSTQALYFHLGMAADDDGFVNNAKKIQRGIGASPDDLSLLVAKKFIIPFESGVVVIKHWRINNAIRNDRKNATKYSDEYGMLVVQENGAYSLAPAQAMLTQGKQGSEQALRNLGGICLANDGQMTGKCPSNDGIDIDIDTGIDIEQVSITSGRPDAAKAVAEIVDYLNAKVGTSYKPTTKKTASSIRARLDEGYTIEDFKAVIDSKASQWGRDPKMREYLRPQTLFIPANFESYLQAARMEVGADARFAEYD